MGYVHIENFEYLTCISKFFTATYLVRFWMLIFRCTVNRKHKIYPDSKLPSTHTNLSLFLMFQ